MQCNYGTRHENTAPLNINIQQVSGNDKTVELTGMRNVRSGTQSYIAHGPLQKLSQLYMNYSKQNSPNFVWTTPQLRNELRLDFVYLNFTSTLYELRPNFRRSSQTKMET